MKLTKRDAMISIREDTMIPIREDYDDTIYCCPRCDYQLEYGQKYCDDCGQKLDWSAISVNYDGSEITK